MVFCVVVSVIVCAKQKRAIVVHCEHKVCVQIHKKMKTVRQMHHQDFGMPQGWSLITRTAC